VDPRADLDMEVKRKNPSTAPVRSSNLQPRYCTDWDLLFLRLVHEKLFLIKVNMYSYYCHKNKQFHYFGTVYFKKILVGWKEECFH